MRFLLDTNILIPLEDSQVALSRSLADFVRLAGGNGHQLLYHPASEEDIQRDTNLPRREQTLARLRQYDRLDHLPQCPWNTPDTDPNDAADNAILYAVGSHAARFLVTEDLGIHKKAKAHGLDPKVLTIQTAADLLRRLHEREQVRLPDIAEVPLHAIVDQLPGHFFDSLRAGYAGFDGWFRSKAEEGRSAWACRAADHSLRGLCIFTIQTNERVTEEGLVLHGPALKLCTFKVGDADRGQKVGELLLKAAFRYASQNGIENIFITAEASEHQRLIELLEEFGFANVGLDLQHRDLVFVKEHPATKPANVDGLDPVSYHRKYFPHFLDEDSIRKFVVPVMPEFHQILFPDYRRAGDPSPLFEVPRENAAGNAIKLAYLCNANTNQVRPGDLFLFYRTHDQRTITSLGVVEYCDTLSDPDAIIGLVRRRTVYSMEDITEMVSRPTKVFLFRLVEHFPQSMAFPRLTQTGILNGAPQSITQISHDRYLRFMDAIRA